MRSQLPIIMFLFGICCKLNKLIICILASGFVDLHIDTSYSLHTFYKIKMSKRDHNRRINGLLGVQRKHIVTKKYSELFRRAKGSSHGCNSILLRCKIQNSEVEIQKMIKDSGI